MEIAISPVEDTARMPAGKIPSGRDSGLSIRVVKISLGLPSQAAE
jgi:hypothetical protein